MSSDFHDYDSLFAKEFRFQVGGQRYVLRTPSAAADLENQRIQFQGASVDGLSVKPIYEKVIEAKAVYVAHSCKREDGAAVTVDEVRAWPEPVVDDLNRRANEFAGSKDDPDTLRKGIARLQERLAKIEAEGDPAKN